ncbi:hypothetical protein KKH05_00160 [Patescibacteria group bacterium]|nr:hypothetical protein [Patescibacteria group bacterium]
MTENWEYMYRLARVVHIDYIGQGHIEVEMIGAGSEPLTPVPLDIIFDFVWSDGDDGIYPLAPGRFASGREMMPEPAKKDLEIMVVYVRDRDWPSEFGYYPIGWGHRSAFEEVREWQKMDPIERNLRLGAGRPTSP